MSKQNIALITGVTGQDGSYLAELLLDKGYDVHGVIRRSSVDYRERIAHLEGRPHFHLHYADLGDSMSIVGVVADVRPTEIYNLAAQSHVQVSFDSPEFTADVDAVGVLRIIEAVRKVGLANSCKIYQASTSELYGKVEEVPQNENTPFHPFSPYAVAKQYGFWIIKEYRDAYGMFCCNGILFNHESERRGENFVTRKITLAASRINVLDISQTILQGDFTMVMLVDAGACDIPFAELAALLEREGEARSLDIRAQREDIFNAMHRI